MIGIWWFVSLELVRGGLIGVKEPSDLTVNQTVYFLDLVHKKTWAVYWTGVYAKNLSSFDLHHIRQMSV